MKVENLPDEVWKDVPDYEGLYKVSNMGRVYSIKKDVLITSRIDSNISYVRLYRKKDGTSVRLASLVYNVFNNSDVSYNLIQFKDFDSYNCKLSNLQLQETTIINPYSSDEELWKSITLEGFVGLYEVSNFGNVRKLNGSNLKIHVDLSNKLRVNLRNSFGKVKTFLVADLVYNTFYGTNRSKVDYKDGNRQNVHLSNLM